MFSPFLLYSVLLLPAVWGFGLTESGDSYIVDTEGDLIFTVNSTNGDITSLKYNGIEAQDQGSRHSQISSGIGASCDWVRTGNSDNYIKITCTTDTLVQYYVARYKDPSIHMATYTTEEPSVGELRFIARLSNEAVPNGNPAANLLGDDSEAIEASDVFLVDGETRSKFYSARKFIDDAVKGVTGDGIGVYMVIYGQGFEGSSGGPFFRDIDNQGVSQQELYFYMVSTKAKHRTLILTTNNQNSGHTQTERWVSTGPTPLSLPQDQLPLLTSVGAVPTSLAEIWAILLGKTVDPTFWAGLGDVSGLVPQSGRGRVSGKATGFPSKFSSNITIGFSNSDAQYWAITDSSGSFVSPYMKPGTYTMTLYKVELAIGSQNVTVSEGSTTSANIASTEESPDTIWQIGDFDGTPGGFLNADKIETMHPSDSRMSDWGPITFAVGDDIDQFPMAVFKDIGGVTIKFELESSQTGARTLDIATTLAFAGGRPVVEVNDWTSKTPAAPSQPDSRGITRGTWRGNNILYTYSIPSGTLVEGSNTISISVVSGSSGDKFL
ncbi:hypothetical protein V5O48_011108 [Marasmius crinis-equi]|uniref:rhamnogalacturonan endolyase n=1 Tax=Marasmius crinis-equi TaxID=585013 RepID=A0ABR3F6K1_9AGAR